MKRLWLSVILAAVLIAAIAPLDEAAARLAERGRDCFFRGDAKRTIETVQQYGDLATLLVVAAILWLLDRRQRPRLLDLALAAAASAGACQLVKILVGRPRPQTPGDWRLWHFWQWSPSWQSEFHALPSSHTAAAVVLSVFLIALYPRLKPFAAVMVIVVAAARVITGAHYPTDVLVGATIAWLVARPIVESRWPSKFITGPTQLAEQKPKP